MAGAHSRASRTCCGAITGLARGGAAWNVAPGVTARDTVFAFRWAAIWWSGCRSSFGARDLVGTATRVVQQNSGRDGGPQELVSLDRDAPKLCCGELRDGARNATSLTELESRGTHHASEPVLLEIAHDAKGLGARPCGAAVGYLIQKGSRRSATGAMAWRCRFRVTIGDQHERPAPAPVVGRSGANSDCGF